MTLIGDTLWKLSTVVVKDWCADRREGNYLQLLIVYLLPGVIVVLVFFLWKRQLIHAANNSRHNRTCLLLFNQCPMSTNSINGTYNSLLSYAMIWMDTDTKVVDFVGTHSWFAFGSYSCFM